MLEQHDDIFAELPEHRTKISQLMRDNRKFALLVDDYAMLAKKIFTLEARGAPVGDRVIEDLKKQRLHLKDQIFAAL